MAFGDPYASVELYKARFNNEGAGDDAEILLDLKATSRWLERKLDVPTFFAGDELTAQIIVPKADINGLPQRIMRVPAIASLDDIEVIIDTDLDGDFDDEVALAGTDFELLPLDAASRPVPVPWSEISLTSWGTQGSWPVGGRVQVTAYWGWPGGAPEGIVKACLEFTAMVRGESPYYTGRVNELADVESMSAQARSTLKGLMMVYSPTGGIAVG